MKSTIDILLAEIEALEARIEILSPLADQKKGDTGLCSGMRTILETSYSDALHFAWGASRSTINVVDELLTIMEVSSADQAREAAEEAAWRDSMTDD